MQFVVGLNFTHNKPCGSAYGLHIIHQSTTVVEEL